MANAIDLIQSIENLKEEVPELSPGDTVKVHLRIVEGNRERVQVVQGVVIRIRGASINRTFTVRRIAAHGVGVERTFMIHSPRIEKIEVLRNAHVRRAKLYFLRGRSGKSARLRERRD
jgi:large subunit ribosomal protein L19